MHKRELASPRCATCELELTPHRRAVGFCCGGCERGGPCTCSYDEVVRLADGRPGVPISAAAFAQLQQRLIDVADDVDLLLPDANAHAAEGIAHAGFYCSFANSASCARSLTAPWSWPRMVARCSEAPSPFAIRTVRTTASPS